MLHNTQENERLGCVVFECIGYSRMQTCSFIQYMAGALNDTVTSNWRRPELLGGAIYFPVLLKQAISMYRWLRRGQELDRFRILPICIWLTAVISWMLDYTACMWRDPVARKNSTANGSTSFNLPPHEAQRHRAFYHASPLSTAS